MTKTYNYNWRELLPTALVLPLLAIYIVRNGGEADVIAVIAVALYVVWVVATRLWPMTRVQLATDEIRLQYLLPFRRHITLRFDEIDHYVPIEFQRKQGNIPIAGRLTLRAGNEPAIMLNANTMKNFNDLHDELKRLFPVPE